ncbi:MAG TPA: hypothetical protein VFI28_02790 [Candidatus Limnocylindrales bacterium]|nr:hypothetical protein [Candidatus Limnocylindrales bacterium]
MGAHPGRVVVELSGQAAKRGIIPRLPAGERLLADVEAWLRAEQADFVRAIGCGRRDERATIAASLHPAARDLVLEADDAGRVTATAETSGVGPGYQTYVARLLERLGEDLSIEWEAVDASDAQDTTDSSERDRTGGRFVATDRPAIERSHLAWLGSELARAREARRRGAMDIPVGMPADVRFAADAALVTPLGPRDDAWLERALADPRIAIDILPWWTDATDARYLLARGMCLMWTEIRWRAPASDDERAVDDDALALLRRAFPLEPTLPYPWREWHELVELRGASDAMARQVAERSATGTPEPAGDPIGYRRREVTIVQAGWQLDVPGSFTGRRTDDEWSGGEGGRRITLAGTETGDERGPMRPQAFLDLVAADLGPDLVRHEDGPLVGRARIVEETSSGVSVGVLEGYSAIHGRGAAIRIEFDDPNDWAWAVERWKALAPA